MEEVLGTALDQLKKSALDPDIFTDPIKTLEANSLKKLDLLDLQKLGQYPDKERLNIFRRKHKLDENYRERDPKDPTRTVQPSLQYDPPFPEDVLNLMNWFFESLSKDDPSTSCEALRNAGFYYLLFFLIHPYEDGNKRTSAYIIQSRIHFPLGTKWNSFPSNKKKMEYEVAHVGEEHINWDALIFNLQTFKFRFQKFYKFFLEAILD